MKTSHNNIKNEDKVVPVLDFARKYGRMFVGNFTNKETGEHFTACQFGEDPNYVMVYFSEETGTMSPREIAKEKDKLMVKLADNGKYYLTYKTAPTVGREISKTIVENENQYIIDTEKKIVYHVNDGDVQIVKFNGHNFDSDNFMRWHPYLEEIETTATKPREIHKKIMSSLVTAY